MYNRKSLKQIADLVELAASDFYKQYPPSRERLEADKEKEQTLKDICKTHNCPYKAAKKVLLQEPIKKRHDARSRR